MPIVGSDKMEKPPSWIKWFCGLRTNKFFCEVDEEYIADYFNHLGLRIQVPFFDKALQIIQDREEVSDRITDLDLEEAIEDSSELLYGLIHARYILTDKGLKKMLQKYETRQFGTCPRVYCERFPMLPLGLSDVPEQALVKAYCPKCMNVYMPNSPERSVDGAYFGTGFPHMLFMVHPELRPEQATTRYTPRLYGFGIHPLAYESQRGPAKSSKTPFRSARSNNDPEAKTEQAS